MKKILVTGGCGYIGSHTIVDLVENNNLKIIREGMISKEKIFETLNEKDKK